MTNQKKYCVEFLRIMDQNFTANSLPSHFEEERTVYGQRRDSAGQGQTGRDGRAESCSS